MKHSIIIMIALIICNNIKSSEKDVRASSSEKNESNTDMKLCKAESIESINYLKNNSPCVFYDLAKCLQNVWDKKTQHNSNQSINALNNNIKFITIHDSKIDSIVIGSMLETFPSLQALYLTRNTIKKISNPYKVQIDRKCKTSVVFESNTIENAPEEWGIKGTVQESKQIEF